MTQSELKPCPFDGGAGVLCFNLREPGRPMYWVLCRDCHASPGDKATEAEAIAAWNTRTPPNPSEPLVERVTNAILFAARDDGYDSPVDYGDAEGLAKAALTALPAPADDVTERVNEHLRAARHVMYDEHWLAQAIDKFLSEDAALAKVKGDE